MARMKRLRSSKETEQAVRIRETHEHWLQLRLAGLSCRAIGKEVGRSHVTVAEAIRKCLADIPAEAAETLRTVEVTRIDQALAQLNAIVRDPKTDSMTKIRAMTEIRKSGESRRKLLGLDAKNEVEVTGNIGMAVTTSVICVPPDDDQ